MFKHIENARFKRAAVGFCPEALRGIGEVIAAIRRHCYGIRVSDGRSSHAIGEPLEGGLPRQITQQPAMGADQRVGDDQRARRVEIEAQGTPAGAHHHFAPGAIGTHTEDGAAIDRDIQPTLPRHDMLGAVLGSQRQGLQAGQTRIDAKTGGILSLAGYLPDHRRYRQGPEPQIQGR